MDSTILLVLRIVLLVVLWLFILFALNALRRDTKAAAGAMLSSPSLVDAPAAPKLKSRGSAPQALMVVDGPMQGTRLDFNGATDITLGRASDCTLVLGDDYASARHARLFSRGNEWFVEDLDSRNGTFVGGYRIDQPEKVTTASDIKVGRTTVRLVP